MGKKDKVEELDKDRRKRLEKLAEQWSGEVPSWSLEKLTLVDLRLMLEQHEPLQDLIRDIASVDASPATAARETTELRSQRAKTESARSAVSLDLIRTENELEMAQAQCRALQQDLGKCTATVQQLLQDSQDAELTRKQLEKQLKQTQKELSTCRVELARSGSPVPELTLLRTDAELAQRLELTDLAADDTQALIQIVAVLAQRDNLERLWVALKERCEAQNRPARETETALLVAALTWHNHNWRTRPYRLIEAAPRSVYNYEQFLRSRHTPAGEIVSELRLPGISDGSGKPLCKALVSTH